MAQVCSVCFETFNEENGLALVCGHYSCQDCTLEYFKNMIYSTSINLEGIKCMAKNCVNRWSPDTIITLLKTTPNQIETLNYYERIVNDIKLSMDTSWSRCPKAECNGGTYKSDQKIVVCATCSYRYCSQCFYDHQEDLPCKEDDQSMDITMTSEEEDIVRCPSCFIPIHKWIGCNHITCSNILHNGVVCGYEFCYICQMSWGQFHDTICCSVATLISKPKKIYYRGDRLYFKIRINYKLLANQKIDISVYYGSEKKYIIRDALDMDNHTPLKLSQFTIELSNTMISENFNPNNYSQPYYFRIMIAGQSIWSNAIEIR
jgi:hypothetical protein